MSPPAVIEAPVTSVEPSLPIFTDLVSPWAVSCTLPSFAVIVPPMLMLPPAVIVTFAASAVSPLTATISAPCFTLMKLPALTSTEPSVALTAIVSPFLPRLTPFVPVITTFLPMASVSMLTFEPVMEMLTSSPS